MAKLKKGVSYKLIGGSSYFSNDYHYSDIKIMSNNKGKKGVIKFKFKEGSAFYTTSSKNIIK